MKSILLFSAGKESVYQLHRKSNEIGLLLLFNYGNKAFYVELNSAVYYGKLFDIPVRVIDLPFMNVPPAIKDGIDCNPYVAQRNLIFTSIALHIAETENFNKVLVGVIADGIDYDGSPDFITDMNYVKGSNKNIKVESYTKKLTTHQVIKGLMRLNYDISHLWSCDNPVDKKFCGKCAKCVNTLREIAEDGYAEEKLVMKYLKEKYTEDAITEVTTTKTYSSKREVCSRP